MHNRILDARLRFAADSGLLPGVVAMTTSRDGLAYEGAFGRRRLGEPAPMTPDTVVWIASMTKPLTAAAALLMVDRGRLSLDAPAQAVLPRLAEVGVLEGFDPQGLPMLRPPTRPITLRHLLSHTSGFSYDMWNPDIRRYQQATGTPSTFGCRKAALFAPLLFDPGEGWEYGIGVDWAGQLVEAAAGKRLGEVLRDELIGPLGMDDTGFRISPAMRARLAPLHQRGDDGVALLPLDEFELPQAPEFEMGGGGLYGTLPDYLKFLRLMLNGGRTARGVQLLAPRTIELMSRNAIGTHRVSMLKSAIARVSNDAEWFPGIAKSWSLAFQVLEADAPTGMAKGSLSWCGIANSYCWIDPLRGIGGAFAAPVLPFADRWAWPLFFEFQRAVYAAL